MRTRMAWLADAVRYALSGMGATATDFSLYSVLHYLAQWTPPAANLVSRPAGGIVSFLLHRSFTFQNRGTAPVPVQVVRFVSIWIASFCISQSLVWLGYRLTGGDALVIKLFAEGSAVIFSFISHRCWTFARSRKNQLES